MKTWKAMMAALLLGSLVLSSCATMSTPVTEQEEEEAIQLQKDRWGIDPAREGGGDND
jgi:hypothetical protein